MTVYILRHAQSTANAGLPYEATRLVELSDQGIRQAYYFAQWYKKRAKSNPWIITSSYVRSQQTAQPLRELYPQALEILPIHEFQYISEKRTRGFSFEQIVEECKVYWERNDPTFQDGSDTESFNQFLDRVASFDRLLQSAHSNNPDTDVVLVTHGRFLKAWCHMVSRKPKNTALRVPTDLRDLGVSIPNTGFMIYPSMEVHLEHLPADEVTELQDIRRFWGPRYRRQKCFRIWRVNTWNKRSWVCLRCFYELLQLCIRNLHCGPIREGYFFLWWGNRFATQHVSFTFQHFIRSSYIFQVFLSQKVYREYDIPQNKEHKKHLL